MRFIVVVLLSLTCAAAYAQQAPTKEQKDAEKTLLARIQTKQDNAQGFFQHFTTTRDPSWLRDGLDAMRERYDAEFALVDLYLQEARTREARSRLTDVPRAVAKWARINQDAWNAATGFANQAMAKVNDLEYAEAEDLWKQG